jgi:hypothetical protein
MTEQQALDLEAWAKDLSAAEATLPDSLPSITRMVMAQDIVSAARAERRLLSGEVNAAGSVYLVGSYAKLDYALRLVDAGKLSMEWLLHELPSLWRGSDPDDTDPRFLELWKEARRRAGRVVRDETANELFNVPLPRRTFLVYRGQRSGDPLGIAWSSKREVAEAFARGASFRGPIRDGELIVARARPSRVLAYITGRGEYEVIIDPKDLR